jgi:hypothetical protein
MRDEYTSAFYKVVKQTQSRYGYDLPFDIEVYVVMLLSSHMDKKDFLPQDSFAESYMKLKGIKAKELGDTCLFTVGVFPEYGKRKGLTQEYFSNIGRSSYDIATSYLDDKLFSDLRDHFKFLSKFINVCVTDEKQFGTSLFLANH